MTLAKEPRPLLDDYPQQSGRYDEVVDADGTIRPAAGGAMRALAGRDLEELAVAVERHGADEGVVFHSAVGDEVFVIDPVPRVIAAAEWARIEAGLAQRVRALNAFVADVYGERRIVAEGVVPQRVIEGAEYFEPGMEGVEPPGGLWIGIAGLDLVRDADGRFRVLEDNVRTPAASPTRPPPGARWSRTSRSRPPTTRARSTRCRRCSGTRCARPPSPTPRRAPSCSPTASTTRPTTSTSGRPTQLGVPLVEPDALDLDARRRRLPPHRTPTASTPASASCCSTPIRAGTRRGRQRVRHRGGGRQARRTRMSRT